MDRLSALPSELLDMICQFVQTYGGEHIASLRACNHCLTDAASQYLFSVLVTGTRKRFLRRMKWVAARPQFARGVREIEYDVTKYQCYPDRCRDRREWLSSMKVDRSWMPTLHYWWNLHHDQEQISDDAEEMGTLVRSLPYFHHVRAATISNRDWRRRSQIPFPCLDLVAYTMSSDHQTWAYLDLVQAFAIRPHRLREFSVLSPDLEYGEMLSGMSLLQSPDFLKTTQAAFKHLTVVCLASYVGCNFGVQAELEDFLKLGVIAKVLGCAKRLRRLSLTFRFLPCHRREVLFVSVIGKNTWSSLKEIELDGIAIPHATELCDFLHRHRETMTTITLRNIRLMDPQWVTVADCLRGLPNLSGLLLEGLQVDLFGYLDCFTVMEINDRAMEGRHNNLISDRHTLLGSLNCG